MQSVASILPSHAFADIDVDTEALSIIERWITRRLPDVHFGLLTLHFPSGGAVVLAGNREGPRSQITIRSLRLFARLAWAGDLGLAEGYIAGEWDSPDVGAVLMFGAANWRTLDKTCAPSSVSQAFGRIVHAFNRNSRPGSRRNIAAHYDLGNDFYRYWLDYTMTYSAAVFDAMDEALDVAQVRKYLRLCEELEIQPGDRVLEIGCGWGGFAEIAARDYGCEVVCLTLSVEQAKFAQNRMARLGLHDKVDVRVQDYRDVEGQFDKIVSIEMFEAVGEAYWPVYTDVLSRRLANGGKAALQIITINEEGFEAYRRTPDFIQRYVFPGGMLPSPERFEREIRSAGLRIRDAFFFGASYAETLRRWQANFENHWAEIRGLGFDDRFRRLWFYYLSYCTVGFETGRIDVGHFIVEPR